MGTGDHTSAGRDEVELAHGALIQDWPRLRAWLDEDRPGLLLRESLWQAAQEWDRHGREEDYLAHQGARLDNVRALTRLPHLVLNGLEQDYLRASVTKELAEQRDRAELAEQAQQELARRLAAQRLFLRVVSVLLVLVAGIAVVALVYRVRAENERDISLARALAAQALGEHDRGDDERAALLARQAYLFDRDGTAREQIGTALQATIGTPFFSRIWRDPDMPVSPLTSLALDKDGKYLAAASIGDRTVRIWDLHDPSRKPLRLTCHGSAVTAVGFSPEGDILASGGATGSVILWDLTNLESAFEAPDTVADERCKQSLRATVVTDGFPQNGNVRAITFARHPHGDADDQDIWVIAGGCDRNEKACRDGKGIVRVWDVKAPGAPVILDVPDQEVWSVAVSSANDLLVAGTCPRVMPKTGYCDPDTMGNIFAWNLTATDLQGLSAVTAKSLEDFLREKAPGNVDGPERNEKSGHLGGVAALAFSPSDSRLASGGGDRAIHLWDLTQPTSAPTVLSGHDAEVRAVAFSPDGTLLLSGGQDEVVRVWDVSRDLPERGVAVLGGSEEWIRSLAFVDDPDGNFIFAATSAGGTARVWQMEPLGGDLAQSAILRGHDSYVRGIAFAPDGETLVSSGEDGTVRFWGTGSIEITSNPTLIDDPNVSDEADESWKITAVGFSPDGRFVAAGDDQGNVWLWSPSDPSFTRRIIGQHRDDEAKRTGVTTLAFDPTTGRLASGGMDGAVRLWDPLKEPSEAAINPPLAVGALPVRSLTWAPDGTMLVAGGCELAGPCKLDSGYIAVWTLAKEGPFLVTDTSLVRCDTGSSSGQGSESVNADLLCGNKGVAGLAFGPAGLPMLASGHADGTILLWNIGHRDGELTIDKRGELQGHDGEVRSLAFSSNPVGGVGVLLASGSTDQTTRLWDPTPSDNRDVAAQLGSTLQQLVDALFGRKQPGPALATIGGREEFVRALAFSPRPGGSLVSASADGTIRISIANSDALAAMVCERISRNLSDDDWQRFVGSTVPYERTCLGLPPGDGVLPEDGGESMPAIDAPDTAFAAEGSSVAYRLVPTGN